MTSDADRFRLDPRRLPSVEAGPLEHQRIAGTITAPDLARLTGHYRAQRDDALRRNVVPRGEAFRAALADPLGSDRRVLSETAMSGLVARDFHTRDWVRTKLGDEVLALIEKDRDT